MKALSVYISIYYLIPRFFSNNQFLKFIVLVASTIVVTAFLGKVTGLAIVCLIAGSVKWSLTSLLIGTYSGVYETITITLAAIAIKIVQLRIQSEQQTMQLQKDKLETELNFLKAQVNPHFLFNTINSIYVLIESDKNLARDYLHRFSNMLRYQLYQCNEDKIMLEKEIEFISSYIELERLRKSDTLKVDFQYSSTKNDYLVAPFIFLPLIENAFKYVTVNSKNESYIIIRVHNSKEQLKLIIKNSISVADEIKKEIEVNGIGLANVKRRLALIYSGKHTLEIQKTIDEFVILLSITNS